MSHRRHVVALTTLVLGSIAITAQAQSSVAPQANAAEHIATAVDSSGIRDAALDYIQGWYEGNAERMQRALHPELAKRIVRTDPRTGRSSLGTMGALTLINSTKAGGGSTTPAAKRRTDYRLLDIYENAAVARVDAGDWVDYLQLAKWNGRWVIVNVLWELRPPSP
jgi:Putative lumazine-binding